MSKSKLWGRIKVGYRKRWCSKLSSSLAKSARKGRWPNNSAEGYNAFSTLSLKRVRYKCTFGVIRWFATRKCSLDLMRKTQFGLVSISRKGLFSIQRQTWNACWLCHAISNISKFSLLLSLLFWMMIRHQKLSVKRLSNSDQKSWRLFI